MTESSSNNNMELLKNLTEQLNFRDKHVFESERQFRGFFENSAAGMCIVDINTGYFIKVNPALTDWLGYTSEELLSHPIVHFLIPDSIEKTQQAFDEIKEEKKDKTIRGFINQYRHKLGHGVWLKWNSSIISEKNISYNVCVNITKEIEQGHELMKTKDLYRRITENSHEIICLHHPNGVYKYVSPSMRDTAGWTPEEMINQNPYDFFHAEDKDRVLKESHQKALDSENGEIEVRYRFRCKNGQYIWLETRTTPFVDENGKVIELKTSSKDISKQIELEKSLKTSQEIYKQIVCNSNELLKLYKIENNIPILVYVSPSCTIYTGYSIEEHLKMSMTNMIHPEDAEDVINKVMDVLKTQRKITIKYRGRHKVDGYKWAESVITPIVTNQQVEYILLSSRVIQGYHDIIEECQYENTLFHDLTRALHQNIIIQDKNMNVLWVSDNTRVMLGWSPEEIKNNFGDGNSFVHPEDKNRISELYLNAVRDGVGFTTFTRVLNKNIGYRWSKMKVSVLLDSNHNIDRIVTFNEDVHDEFIKQRILEKDLEMKIELGHIKQVGTFEMSFHGKERIYTYLSKGMYDIYDIDYEVDKIKVRKIINESIDEKTMRLAQKQLEDMLQGLKDEFELTYWVTTIAGARKLLTTKAVVKRTKHKIASLIGTVQDITSAYIAFKNTVNNQ